MADHNPQHGRRPHYRGRRGPDRRGGERRSPPGPAPDHAAREPREAGGIDVEQIMRDIRSRIAQRHGIELTNPQIQELAARRLDAILEPRNVKPQLLEQLRKSAGAGPDLPDTPAIETYSFEETTLYETHRGLLRFFRKLLHPILKLFFNPTPLVHALNTQARINQELVTRDAARDRRQSEWNALHYELVQRMVTETARVSIEMQALNARLESLSAKVDFNERRVRGIETVPAAAPPRPQPPARHVEPSMAAPSPVESTGGAPAQAPAGDATGDGPRRRRRRRRPRRGGSGLPGESAGPVDTNAPALDGEDIDGGEADGDDEEPSAAEPTALASPVEQAAEPHVVPTPPPDEPTPNHPVDHVDPGPEER